jgi:uncharacterized protein
MIFRLTFAGLLAVVMIACADQASSKKELASKVVTLQQPGIDSVARGLAEQPLMPMLQAAGQAVQAQVPAEQRDATAKAIDAEARKYLDEVMPLLRERATALAPGVLGPLLEEKFNEDELRQLATWLQSPLYKKYQEVAPSMQRALAQKVVSETRVAVEPKLKALEGHIAVALGVAPKGVSASPAASAAASKAKP